MFRAESCQYLRERILKARIGLLWLLLLIGGLLTNAEPLTHLPWLALGSALFILAFRLCDDLADLAHDRAHHPQRCLVRSVDLQPFRAAQWFLFALLIWLLAMVAEGGRVLAFLVLVVAILALYRVTRNQAGLRPLRTVLVLAKYPAFVLLLARRPSEPGALLVALGIYLLPLLDEVRVSGLCILLPAATCVGLACLTWLALAT
jgi:hypothetical protein